MAFRFYTEADVVRLELVETLRPLDLSLDQIRELVETMDTAESSTDPAEVEQIAGRLAMYRVLAESRVETLRAPGPGTGAAVAACSRFRRTLREAQVRRFDRAGSRGELRADASHQLAEVAASSEPSRLIK